MDYLKNLKDYLKENISDYEWKFTHMWYITHILFPIIENAWMFEKASMSSKLMNVWKIWNPWYKYLEDLEKSKQEEISKIILDIVK